jgi:hypothetical protein
MPVLRHSMTRCLDLDGEGLNAEDAEIDALGPAARAAVAKIWMARARSEFAAATVFGELAEVARSRSTAPEVVDLLVRAAADEVNHCDVCRHVASRYLGAAASRPVVSPGALPVFGAAAPALNATLNIVLNSCINETLAAALLRECREEARGTIAKRALRILLRDEMDHARIGWAHLASAQVTDAEKRQVSAAIPALVRFAHSAWTKSSGDPSPDAVGHGWVPDERVKELFDEVLAEVIVPGFRHVGLDVR